MRGKKRQKKTAHEKNRRRSVSDKKPVLNPETLRRDFTDPARLQRAMDCLGEAIRHDPDLATLRFPPEKLMDALDDLAETSSGELESIPDLLSRRITILNRTIHPFLTTAFERHVEDILMKRLDKFRTSPREFRATGAGLYFLEIHKRQRDNPGGNPLWNVIFDISYDEAIATAGGAVKQAVTQEPGTGDHDVTVPGGYDFTGFIPDDLSRDSFETQTEALALIESASVDIAFSLDTILLGLRELALNRHASPEQCMSALRTSYRKEIGVRQWHDMAWGLEQAVDSSTGAREKNYRTVHKALLLLPPEDNPVVFALYCTSVTRYRRFLDPAETDFAENILANPEAVEPLLAVGRYLLTRDAPGRALNAFIAASISHPADEMARFGAGVACRLSGSLREARLHWDRADRLWSGYLPDHHPTRVMLRELADLDDDTSLPQKALKFLFFEPFSEKDIDHGETDTNRNTV